MKVLCGDGCKTGGSHVVSWLNNILDSRDRAEGVTPAHDRTCCLRSKRLPSSFNSSGVHRHLVILAPIEMQYTPFIKAVLRSPLESHSALLKTSLIRTTNHLISNSDKASLSRWRRKSLVVGCGGTLLLRLLSCHVVSSPFPR